MAQKRFSYSAEFKIKIIQFAKVNENRAAERKFGPPRTEKTIRGEVCTWVRRFWDNEIVVKSFKKCGISNVTDGTEDEAIYKYIISSSDTDEDKLNYYRMDESFDSDEEFYGFYDE